MGNNKQPITIAATVNVPVATVWTLWTTPTDIMQWNSASPDWHTPKATNDLQPGGTFSYTMASKDGCMSFDFGGTYTAVSTHELIAYTLGDGRKATVTFTANGDTTHITTIFEAEDQNSIELQQAGWQAILDNFKQYAESK